MKENIGLVLEGGGMRGIYTAGVLDFLMDNNIYFPYVIGVSMGACNATSYISRQRGRNKIVDTQYIKDKRYISYTGLFKNKSLFGMDFIFDEIPNNLCLFDFKTFNEAKEKLVIVATDIEKGEPVYFEKENCEDILKIVRASSSLPFVAPIVEAQGKKLLDGGICDSIPVEKAIKDGNEKIIVVLTRNYGYTKKPFKFKKITSAIYKNYPNLVDKIESRYRKYNDTIKYVEELEKEGKAFIIRPSTPTDVKRVERDKNKLEKLYEVGYMDAKEKLQELLEFIK